METIIDVKYNGVETLLVYIIPAICKGIPPKYKDKGKKQYPEDMCYIGQPFNTIVKYKDIKKIKKKKKDIRPSTEKLEKEDKKFKLRKGKTFIPAGYINIKK